MEERFSHRFGFHVADGFAQQVPVVVPVNGAVIWHFSERQGGSCGFNLLRPVQRANRVLAEASIWEGMWEGNDGSAHYSSSSGVRGFWLAGQKSATRIFLSATSSDRRPPW